MRRLVLLLVPLVLTTGACAHDGVPPPWRVVGRGHAATVAAGSARVHVTATAAGRATVEGEGRVDLTHRRSTIVARVADLGGDVEVRRLGAMAYLRFPALDPDRWLALDATGRRRRPIVELDGLDVATDDPGRSLDLLHGVAHGDVHAAGRDAIGSRYRVVVRDPGRARTISVWIGRAGLVRRLRLPLEGGRVVLTIDLRDFHAPVRIAPPPAGAVVPLPDVLRNG